MGHRILLVFSFLYLSVSNIIWIARDSRPPFWDMAYHQSGALKILKIFQEEGVGGLLEISGVTGLYPPFYHSVVAAFYYAFGVASESAQLANLPATAILVGTTYAIGRSVLPPDRAALASAITGFYPMLLWLSRESTIDYWLAAMVTLAMWLLIESDGFRKRSIGLLFGVVCGLGMLTKPTFALFLALPALWCARTRWKEAMPAGVIALIIASYWYLPNYDALLELFRINTTGGTLEGDPDRLSWQALTFYPRALAGYQLFTPLFALFLAGVIWLRKHFKPEWWPILLWGIGGWAGLMLFLNKDPRYSVPLLPVIALISAGTIRSRKIALLLLMPFLLFQHYLVSFGVGALPETIIIARGVKGPLSWDWNLYTQRYFGLWGPPAKEDWKINYVLDRIQEDTKSLEVRLGIVPDIPRFDYQAFKFLAESGQHPVVLQRHARFDKKLLNRDDYLLMSESTTPMPGAFQPEIDQINKYIVDNSEQFQVMEWFALPNGELIRLYRVLNPS